MADEMYVMPMYMKPTLLGFELEIVDVDIEVRNPPPKELRIAQHRNFFEVYKARRENPDKWEPAYWVHLYKYQGMGIYKRVA